MVSVSMPWEIVKLPFRGQTRDYKKFADGGSVVATDEESRVWAVVQGLRAENEEMKLELATRPEVQTPGLAAPAACNHPPFPAKIALPLSRQQIKELQAGKEVVFGDGPITVELKKAEG